MANPAYSRYEEIAAEIDRAIRFMAACGADFDALRTVEFFASHEGLLLDYERPLTRIDSRTGLPYDCSGHFVWIGERTRQLDGAHVDYFSRVQNPLGIKLGPTTTGDDALALIDKLNPSGEAGRITFITRMGAGKVRDLLPALVEKVTADGRPVTWVCDPMHGNGITSATGYKTRRFSDVMDEVAGFFEVHRAPRHRPRRAAHRAHRRRRHRGPGRHRGDRRRGPVAPLRDARRPAPEPPAVAGDGVPGRRAPARRRAERRPGGVAVGSRRVRRPRA